MSMFCYQCEQTAGGTGCTVRGVCGKDAETAALQDLLIHAAKGISRYAHRSRQMGRADPDVDVFVIEALFTTVTNVNFDPQRLASLLRRSREILTRARSTYEDACRAAGREPADLALPGAEALADDLDELIRQGRAVSIANRLADLGEDVVGLQELLTYGLKGTASYADHARILGQEDDAVYAYFHEALDFLTSDAARDVEQLTAAVLRCGEVNLKVMGLLDAANTGGYGQPEPTAVRITPVAGKCIVVSGHDLKDLAELLEQTAGTGVNVYTHGEMLPCHGYPGLKRHKHLVGNYGGAWQDQRREFDEFPGAILMTTNCIQKPKDSYKGRIFTTGLVAWPDVRHIPAGPDGKKDFTPVIEAAQAAAGFAEDAEAKTITVGFARSAVLGVADKVVTSS